MIHEPSAHDLGLLHDLVGKRALMRARFIADQAQGRLERVREIADVGARPIDDLAVRSDPRVKLAPPRPALLRGVPLARLRLPGAGVGARLAPPCAHPGLLPRALPSRLIGARRASGGWRARDEGRSGPERTS